MPPSPAPRRALTHPLWWASLALLVVNDHVLKGAGLLPPWLTGKLSDLAGLVMAPALCAAVANARTARTRTLAMLPVVALFTAIKLSPAAAAALAAVMTTLGVPWHTVVDPTDLVALLALPLAWYLVTRPALPRAHHPRVARLAVLVGAVASIATSPPPPDPGPWNTEACVLNRTGRTLDLRMRWIDGQLDCANLLRAPSQYVTRASFSGLQVTFALEDGHTLPLNRLAAANALGGDRPDLNTAPTNPLRCDVVLLSADGMPDTLAYWRELPSQQVSSELDTTEASATTGRIELRTQGETISASSPRNEVTIEALPIDPPEVACNLAAQRYEWAGRLPPGTARLDALTALDDGCTAVIWSLPTTTERGAFYYCAPAQSLPMAPGDNFTAITSQTPSVPEHVLILAGPSRTTRLYQGTLDTLRQTGVDGLRLNVIARQRPTAGCDARRDACGAYVEPLGLDVVGLPTVLAPGASGTTSEPSPRTLWLGRLDRVLVSSARCNSDYTTASTYLDFVLTGAR